MTRKFKMVGALMAVVAMFAVTASSASADFTSAGYPATATASSTADVFDAFGSTVKCTNNTFTGELKAASSTLTIVPTYKSCTAFGLPATVNFAGCSYIFHKPTGLAGTVDLSCTGGKVVINIYSSAAHTTQLCELQVPTKLGLSGYTLTNEAGKVKIAGTVGGLTAKITHRTSISCPLGPEETGAKYTIQAAGIVVSGSNGAVSVD